VNPKFEVNKYVREAESHLKEENFESLTTDLKGRTGVRLTNKTVLF
jgi:hypothetical protein